MVCFFLQCIQFLWVRSHNFATLPLMEMISIGMMSWLTEIYRKVETKRWNDITEKLKTKNQMQWGSVDAFLETVFCSHCHQRAPTFLQKICSIKFSIFNACGSGNAIVPVIGEVAADDFQVSQQSESLFFFVRVSVPISLCVLDFLQSWNWQDSSASLCFWFHNFKSGLQQTLNFFLFSLHGQTEIFHRRMVRVAVTVSV